ncbi:MAG: transporter, partial [Motiliproteus sp.]
MNKQLTGGAFSLALILGFCNLALAQDLVDLIPSLYGGDGITLSGVDAVTGATIGHAPHFTQETQSAVNQLNTQIGKEIRALPISSTPGGVSYRFDSELGTYSLTRRNLGPVLGQSSHTLGAGNWSFAVTATRFEYDEFDGDDISSLIVDALHQFDVINPDPNAPERFEKDIIKINFDLDIEVETYSFYFAYGVQDNLDLSLVVPIVSVDMSVNSRADIIFHELDPNDPGDEDSSSFHTFTGAPDGPTDSASGDDTGIGDVILAAKYHYGDWNNIDLAAALVVKLETGDEHNFRGTGSTTVQPAVYAEYEIGDFWGVHGNLGYEWDTDDSIENTLR